MYELPTFGFCTHKSFHENDVSSSVGFNKPTGRNAKKTIMEYKGTLYTLKTS